MSTQTAHNDQAVIEAIRSGSVGAFERFFKAHYQPLCGFALSYVKDPDAAEDVVQQTFFTIWQKRENLTLSQSLKSYVYTSVRNTCLNKIKAQKVRDDFGAESLRQADEADAQDPLHAMELSERIQQAIDTMPPERQKIFLLSRHEGLKYKEIAEQLGKSIKTVENQMGKALKYMREELADFLALVIFLNFFN